MAKIKIITKEYVLYKLNENFLLFFFLAPCLTQQSVQMEFMLETIFDIKNNKKRAKEDPAHHTRIKKWLQKVLLVCFSDDDDEVIISRRK